MFGNGNLFWANLDVLCREFHIDDSMYKEIVRYKKAYFDYLLKYAALKEGQFSTHSAYLIQRQTLERFLLQAEEMAFSLIHLLDISQLSSHSELEREKIVQSFFGLLHKLNLNRLSIKMLIEVACSDSIARRSKQFRKQIIIDDSLIEDIGKSLLEMPEAKTPQEVWSNLNGECLSNSDKFKRLELLWMKDQKLIESLPLEQPKKLLKVKGCSLQRAVPFISRRLQSAVQSSSLKMNVHQQTLLEFKMLMEENDIPLESIIRYKNILKGRENFLTANQFHAYMTLLIKHREEEARALQWCDSQFWKLPVDLSIAQTITILPNQLTRKKFYHKRGSKKPFRLRVDRYRQHRYIRQVSFGLLRLNVLHRHYEKIISESDISHVNFQLNIKKYLDRLEKIYIQSDKIFEELLYQYKPRKLISKLFSNYNRLSCEMAIHLWEMQISSIEKYFEHFKALIEYYKKWANASLNVNGHERDKTISQQNRLEMVGLMREQAIVLKRIIQKSKSQSEILEKKGKLFKGDKRFRILDIQKNKTRLQNVDSLIDFSVNQAVDHISTTRFISKVCSYDRRKMCKEEELEKIYLSKCHEEFRAFISGCEMKDSRFECLCGELKVKNEDERIHYWVIHREEHRQLVNQISMLLNQSNKGKNEPLKRQNSCYIEQVVKYFIAVKKEEYLNDMRGQVDLFLKDKTGIAKCDVQIFQRLRVMLGPSKDELKRQCLVMLSEIEEQHHKIQMQLYQLVRRQSPFVREKTKYMIDMMMGKNIIEVDLAKLKVVGWESVVEVELKRDQLLDVVVKALETAALIAYQLSKIKAIQIRLEHAVDRCREKTLPDCLVTQCLEFFEQLSFSKNKINYYKGGRHVNDTKCNGR